MKLSILLNQIISLTIDIVIGTIIFYPKRKMQTIVLVWVFLSTAVISFAYYFISIFEPSSLSAYLLPIIFLAACFFLYNNNFTQITFVFFTAWTLSSMLSTTCLYISRLFFSYMSPDNQTLVKMIIYTSVCLIFVLFLKLKMVEPIRRVLDMFNIKFLMFTLFPIFSFALFNAMFGQYKNTAITQHTLIIMVMYIIIIIFAYYFVFFVFRQIYSKTQMEEMLKSSRINHLLQQKFYNSLNENVNRIKIIQHDFRHHLTAIQTLLKNKQLDETDKYIKSLFPNMENLDVQIFCENLSANAIISYYIDRAKDLNIATDVKTSIPQNIQIDNIDLNVVLGNCLENAIEACTKLSDETQRFLNVKAAIVNEYLVINIKNSFNGIANINDGILHTTKVDSKNHGIGLENVRTIVRQYDGTINLNYSENKFETSVIMRNAI